MYSTAVHLRPLLVINKCMGFVSLFIIYRCVTLYLSEMINIKKKLIQILMKH